MALFYIYSSFIANDNNTMTHNNIRVVKSYENIKILIYHYVEYVKDKNDFIRESLNTPPHILEQQILTLKNNNYEFITPKDLENTSSMKK